MSRLPWAPAKSLAVLAGLFQFLVKLSSALPPDTPGAVGTPHVISSSVSSRDGWQRSPAETYGSSTWQPHVADCSCQNWKQAYESGRATCGKAAEFYATRHTANPLPHELAEEYSIHGREICTNFFHQLDNNFCVNVNRGDNKGQWCYVSPRCGQLHGGAPVSNDRFIEFSWKICTQGQDVTLSTMSPRQLANMAEQLDVDLGLLHKMSYPVVASPPSFLARTSAPAWADMQAVLLQRHEVQTDQAGIFALMQNYGGWLVGSRRAQLEKLFDSGQAFSFDTNKQGDTPHMIVAMGQVYTIVDAQYADARHPGTWRILRCASEYWEAKFSQCGSGEVRTPTSMQNVLNKSSTSSFHQQLAPQLESSSSSSSSPRSESADIGRAAKPAESITATWTAPTAAIRPSTISSKNTPAALRIRTDSPGRAASFSESTSASLSSQAPSASIRPSITQDSTNRSAALATSMPQTVKPVLAGKHMETVPAMWEHQKEVPAPPFRVSHTAGQSASSGDAWALTGEPAVVEKYSWSGDGNAVSEESSVIALHR
eukprot:gnl/TRDRNA2_/TRDRNA2_137925_c0_seq2.p1 gnl/TRDRNA2_/TRDRNA2_137925_c0~~gnl/TRDRNA2_/TRDRNA2_137925_c0_seq2.p1  ORF type:complete len:542 (+),score=60.64 gnl/TRDRNA2_/TRDRNA2_137925_c0_seq2:65-1690(+)